MRKVWLRTGPYSSEPVQQAMSRIAVQRSSIGAESAHRQALDCTKAPGWQSVVLTSTVEVIAVTFVHSMRT